MRNLIIKKFFRCYFCAGSLQHSTQLIEFFEQFISDNCFNFLQNWIINHRYQKNKLNWLQLCYWQQHITQQEINRHKKLCKYFPKQFKTTSKDVSINLPLNVCRFIDFIVHFAEKICSFKPLFEWRWGSNAVCILKFFYAIV